MCPSVIGSKVKIAIKDYYDSFAHKFMCEHATDGMFGSNFTGEKLCVFCCARAPSLSSYDNKGKVMIAFILNAH